MFVDLSGPSRRELYHLAGMPGHVVATLPTPWIADGRVSGAISPHRGKKAPR
jgi:hypothetical protein